ncbi:MAG: hypothetical protein OXC02_09855 [Rhodobacteraceae bacterium]|nr:hypothetical protein [Paracoccaceae bacterium]
MNRVELIVFVIVVGLVLIAFGWLGEKLYSKLFRPRLSEDDHIVKNLNNYINQIELQTEQEKMNLQQEKAALEARIEELNQQNVAYLEENRRLQSQLYELKDRIFELTKHE